MPLQQVEQRQVHRLVSLQIDDNDELWLAGSKTLPHDFEDACQTVKVALAEDERLLGFRWHERPDPETGGSRYFNPWVLIRGRSAIRLEALFGEIALPSPVWPGEVRWLPTEAPEESYQEKYALEDLRSLRGREQSHVVGVVYSPPVAAGTAWSVQRLTGAPTMFWIELVLFDLCAYYADVGTDFQQLFLVFLQEGLAVYFYIYGAGIIIAMLVTMWSMIQWLGGSSRERDWLQRCLSKPFLIVLAIILVATQTHILALVLYSAVYRYKHPLLTSAKMAELLEAAVAATVTTSYLIDTLRQMGPAASLREELPLLKSLLSLAMSLCSLGLGYAGRDKDSGVVLGLRGRYKGWGIRFLGIWLVRFAEVTSRVFSFTLIHEGITGADHGLRYALDMTGIFLVMMCLVCLVFRPHAGALEAFAGVFAHPGQLSEASSVLPIGRSLGLHVVLAAAVAFVQGGAWAQPDNEGTGTFWIRLVWAISTVVAMGGLLICWLRPPKTEEHHVLVLASGDSDTLQLGRLERHWRGSRSTPAMSAFVLDSGKSVVVDLDTCRLFEQVVQNADVNDRPHYLEAAIAGLPSVFDFSSHQLPVEDWNKIAGVLQIATSVEGVLLSKCFDLNGDGAKAMLQAMGMATNLQRLHLQECKEIPDDAWEALREVTWPALIEVDLSSCFEKKGGGARAALQAVANSSRRIQKLSLFKCSDIPDDAWDAFRGTAWPALLEVDLSSCFKWSGGGATAAVQALATSARQLQRLILKDGREIPDSAWDGLYGVAWPALLDVDLSSCFAKRGGGGKTALQALATSPQQLRKLSLHTGRAIPDDAWEVLRSAAWPQLTEANFDQCFSRQGAGAQHLLQALRSAPTLQRLQLCFAEHVPEDAWRCLSQGEGWPELRVGWFAKAIVRDDASSQLLLQALSKSKKLQELDLMDCAIPAEAWASVPGGAWPELRSLRGVPTSVPKAQYARVRGGARGRGGAGAAPALGEARPEDQDWEAAAMQAGQSLQELHAAPGCEEDKLLLQAFRIAGRGLRVLQLNGCAGIPAAAWEALAAGLREAQLEKVNLALCFQRSGDGSKPLLEALATCSQLKELNLYECRKITGEAWKALAPAEWPELDRVNLGFAASDSEGAEAVLRVLSRCRRLQELKLNNCKMVAGPGCSALAAAEWPELRTADLGGVFSQSGEGAEAALHALGWCRQLEELNLNNCNKVAGAAWMALEEASWPELRRAELNSTFLESGDGAEAALLALGRSSKLELLSFNDNKSAPSSAWDVVPDRAWPPTCNIGTGAGSQPAPARVRREG